MITATEHHQHFVCDLETLDVNSTAVVLSIALVPFSAATCSLSPIKPLYIQLPVGAIQEQIDAGRTVSAGTLRFWFEQPDAPRNELFVVGDLTWADVVNHVIGYIENYTRYADKRAVMWGNGSGFDCSILRSFIETSPAWRREVPFRYVDDRDVRTVLDLSPESKNVPLPENFVKHEALSDALHEVAMVCDALRRINNRVVTGRIRPFGDLIDEYEDELKAEYEDELKADTAKADTAKESRHSERELSSDESAVKQ